MSIASFNLDCSQFLMARKHNGLKLDYKSEHTPYSTQETQCTQWIKKIMSSYLVLLHLFWCDLLLKRHIISIVQDLVSSIHPCFYTLQFSFKVCVHLLKDNCVLLKQKIDMDVLVATIDAQWEGMGDVGSARYEPALLPPCPTIRVLSYSTS